MDSKSALANDLQNLDSIGEVNAEEDSVLQYFVKTEATSKVATNRVYLVLGRKGAGKTALVRHFTKDDNDPLQRALNLRSYAWNIHKAVADNRGTEIEAFVASWRYVIATQAASALLEKYNRDVSDAARTLRDFFSQNYGDTRVDLAKIFAVKRLIFSKATIEPRVAGFGAGSISFEKQEQQFGFVIDAVTDTIIEHCKTIISRNGTPLVALHFDELDTGIEKLERDRQLMIAGLVLAAQSIRRSLGVREAKIRAFIYLREDIWQAFSFSDRNKITHGAAQLLLWTRETLRELVDIRIRSISGGNFDFDDLVDDQNMPGKQSKWDYIVNRTHDRPRDVIAFINQILEARRDKAAKITNADMVAARPRYSSYFKGEVEDEIRAHWPEWEEALQAIGDIGYLTFEREDFIERYNKRVSKGNTVKDGARALEMFFNYSIIAYLRPRPRGGTDWIWKYKQPDQNFDANAERFKVHTGLQDYANLRSERRRRRGSTTGR